MSTGDSAATVSGKKHRINPGGMIFAVGMLPVLVAACFN